MEGDTYEDEPMTSVRAQQFSGNQLVIENMDDVERKRRKRRRKRRKRLERLGRLAVCVCVIGVIVAIVLTIVLTEAAIAVTAPPPPAPTVAPSPPTYKPTVSHPTPTVPHHTPSSPVAPVAPAPVPVAVPTIQTSPPVRNEYILNPIQDTYVYTTGSNMAKTYGKEETFLVQKGASSNDLVDDALAMMVFDTSTVPSFDQLATEGKSAVLRLYHQPLDITEQNREAAPITISRMNQTVADIEGLNGNTLVLHNWWDGPIISVETYEVLVEVDISDLVFGTPFQDNRLILFLQTKTQKQEVGDRFYSRESDEPPVLTLNNLLP